MNTVKDPRIRERVKVVKKWLARMILDEKA